MNDNEVVPVAICMNCGKECTTWEVIDTGDNESLNGRELWCYCPECDIETFHKITSKENE
jgi:hypothetical protein